MEYMYIFACVFQMHPNVIGVNLLLSGLTVFHLAYLGLMFDSSPSEDRVTASYFFHLDCKIKSTFVEKACGLITL